jgi:hypothetical protein
VRKAEGHRGNDNAQEERIEAVIIVLMMAGLVVERLFCRRAE